jgi:hypothetical protein
MDTLTFREKINLFVAEDLIKNLNLYPNKFLLRCLGEVLDDLKLKIKNHDSLSKIQKKTYLDIIDDPDLLEELANKTKGYQKLSQEETKLDFIPKSPVSYSEDQLLEGKIELNRYLIYQIKPDLIKNYQNLEENLLFY